MINNVIRIIDSIGEKPEEGERLAYLGFTTKIEIPMRDYIGYELQKRIKDHYFVSREFSRTDLAVINLKDRVIKNKIELKACHSFDFCRSKDKAEGKEYKHLIINDFFKHSCDNNTYYILFIFHPLNEISTIDNILGSIKYYPKKSMKLTQDAIKENTLKTINTWKKIETEKGVLNLIAEPKEVYLGKLLNNEATLLYAIWEKRQ